MVPSNPLKVPLQTSSTAPPSPSPLAKPFSFNKACRLLNAADFTPVFNDAPFRASHPHFLVLAKPGKLQARLGLVIAKKAVKRAHERNRLKRLIRESFRHQKNTLPPIDAIVLARKGADSLSNPEINTIIQGLWKRIHKRALSPSAAP